VRKVTARGQSVEEAIQSALKQLTLDKDQVEIEVIDEGKKGFLGIFGSTRAIVKVIEKNMGQADELDIDLNADKKAEPENAAAHIDGVKVFLREVAGNMGVQVEVESEIKDNHVTFHLSGDKIAILIGKRGKTLNAIQYLTQLVLNKDGRYFRSVTVDAEGYRNRRKETLIELAQKMAAKAIRIEGKVALEPMPAYERKIIHSALQHSTEVATYSDGVEPHRYIVIEPK